jgi:hypothetical protein
MDDRPEMNTEKRGESHDGDILPPLSESERVAAAPVDRSATSYVFDPPVSALALLFSHRLDQIHKCRVPLVVDVNRRPTRRVLGGYYRSRRLVRVYSHDRAQGRRPLEELFETFLHEVAHHLEYYEPQSFGGQACRRVYGLMHSRLFWQILGELKWRWAKLQAERPCS